MNSKDRVIVALDTSQMSKIQSMVSGLSPYVGTFKIGLEAMTSFGAPKLVEIIHENGGSVFLDGKFSDIPNTVAKASNAAADLNVRMFNVHASCGIESVKAAVDHKKDSKLFVVTVLTSMNQTLVDQVFHNSIPELVVKFAHQAQGSWRRWSYMFP